MAGETFIQGDDIILNIFDTTASAYEPVACLTSNSLSESLEINETSTKCDPGRIVRTPGSAGYEISGDGIYIDEDVNTGRQSHAKLAELLRGQTTFDWSITTGRAATPNFFGSAILTELTLDAEAGNYATFTFTMSGSGGISTTDPNA